MTAAGIGFLALFLLLVIGVPLGYAMALTGFVGFGLFVGFGPASYSVGQIVVDNVASYGFSVLPLFILMGNFVARSRLAEELFSAARTEFKHLEYFYFHNCLYERVWRENRRRFQETTPTWELLHTYPHDYKAIFVGDASMSPYEIVQPGGSVEHMNAEAGETWMRRVLATYPHAVWLNPVPESNWNYTASIRMMRQLMAGRMYPLTLAGLDSAMRELVR